MVFGRFIGYIRFFFSYRRRVFRLRKGYDRIREKADKERNAEKRLRALKILDQIEPTLTIIEEQRVSRFERMRMFNYVRSGVNEAKKMLKEKYGQEMYRKEMRQGIQPAYRK